jgi:NTE family protein
MDRFIFSVLNQSDFIHVLTSPESTDLRRTRRLCVRLEREFNFRPEKIKVILNEYKLSKITYGEEIEIIGRNVFATLPKIDFESSGLPVLDDPGSEYAKAVRRISREVGECLVGLVLGVGVGYGFCHIGVLKVIEEEKIPIDIIAGSSVGALIAGLWAAGYSSSQILSITEEFKEQRSVWNLIDFTVPLLGFIKGNKLHKFLKKYLGNRTFYDLKLPLKIIASDVRKKEPRVFDKGPLVEAIMASCTMPGVFTPFKFKDELLFDGGVTNPLPTEALLKVGVKKIIAVNVTPSRQDIMRQYEEIRKEMTVIVPEKIRKRKWYDLSNYLRNTFKMNILEIVFSSIEILQSEVAQKEAQSADVVLHPDTSGMFWLELHRAPEFARRGEEETRRNLGRIWEVVNG